jgi:glycosyltransferase involved in cell wall biosynthesis
LRFANCKRLHAADVSGREPLSSRGSGGGVTSVLMLCAHFWPTVGGAERQAELQARALLRRGCHVEVLTMWNDPSWPEREVRDGLTIRRFPLTDLSRRHPGVRGLGVLNSLVQRRQVRNAVARSLPEFDLLHAHLASPIVAFALDAAHQAGKPALCKVACGGATFDFVSLRATSLLGPWLARRLVSRMDRWIAISEEVAVDLRNAGVPESRILRIPNAIDLSDLPSPRRRTPARRFLCMGRLPKFDLDSLVRGFEALVSKLPDAELCIAGGGDPSRLRALVAERPSLQGRVRTPGLSPARAQFEWADAVVHPSFAEGMSNTLLEAMSLGVPCAASDISPNSEVLDRGRAGLLFPLRDPEALGDALVRLASESDLALRLADAARRRVEDHYSIDAVAPRIQSAYEELLGSREPHSGPL